MTFYLITDKLREMRGERLDSQGDTDSFPPLSLRTERTDHLRLKVGIIIIIRGNRCKMKLSRQT